MSASALKVYSATTSLVRAVTFTCRTTPGVGCVKDADGGGWGVEGRGQKNKNPGPTCLTPQKQLEGIPLP